MLRIPGIILFELFAILRARVLIPGFHRTVLGGRGMMVRKPGVVLEGCGMALESCEMTPRTDQVKYSYDGWGNATKIAQDHDSVVSAMGGLATHDVGFSYAKAVPTGGRKTIRRSEMDFPSGYTANYIVPGSGLNSTLVRVGEVELGNASLNSFVTLVTYDYLGVSGLVGTTLPEPDVFSNRFDSSGDYTQLDRFNRPTAWTWTKDLTTDRDFYDVDIVYNERGDIERTIDNIFLNPGGTISHYYDRAYTLDAMGRVLGEERGNWNGSSISITHEDRDWSLTATGNWATRSYDLDGSGVDFAEDNSSPLSTHFNNANEWIYRNVTTGGSDLDPDYDANGNLVTDGENYTYKYDAWNRLVEVWTIMSPTLVAEYRYNGLGHRIAEGDGTDTEHVIYHDRWRLVSRHDGTSYIEETLYHQAGLDGYGGASDVDSVVMRRSFLSTGTPQTEDQRWYVLQNWRQDAAVIIDEAAVQVERAHFSPYGRVFGMPAGDTNFDGAVTNTDTNLISAWSGLSLPYRAYADVDLDGDVDGDDATAANTTTMGWDALSDVGSTVGYAGYVQDSFIPTLSHVRQRVYKSDLGRWIQRDPAGYVDGANLYEYVMGQPIVMRDPMGLASALYQDDPEERRRKRELRRDDWRDLSRKDCEVGVACQNIGSLPVSHCYTYIDCGHDTTWICDGGPDKKRKFSSATSGIDAPLTSGCYKCPDVSPRNPTEEEMPKRDPLPGTPAWDCQDYEENKRGKDTGRKTKSKKDSTWGGANYRICFERVTRKLNSCKYDYDLLGPNSNTVAGCLSAICLGITEPPHDAGPAPGWGWGGWRACDCEVSD